jgi:predicted transcriptional regulator
MSTLTIRLPDDKHARLRQLARHRDISVNKLVEELATISIAEFDAESRFRALAARGSAEKGLALLDKLDAAFAPESGKAGADAKTCREKDFKKVTRKTRGA